MKRVFVVLAWLSLGCASQSKDAHGYIPENAFEVFQKFGCKNCHTMPPTGFTDYGKKINDMGYGCISLQSLAKQHKLSGVARRVFIQNGCTKCHDPKGKGFGDKNLTRFGVKVEERNLGCVGTFTTLLGEN